MKAGWLPWLFPAVLLGAVLLIVVLGNDAAYLAGPVALALFVVFASSGAPASDRARTTPTAT
jgi:hypothetical protein